MSRVAKIKDPVDALRSELEPFCGTDPSRPNLHGVFGFEREGVGYLAATDGHRASLVQCERWKEFERSDAPPLNRIVSWQGQKVVGTITAHLLGEECRNFPKKWSCQLIFGREGSSHRLKISFLKTLKCNRNPTRLYPLGESVDVPEELWGNAFDFPGLEFDLSVQLSYLIDAVDFCGKGMVDVHSGASLDPIVLCQHGETAESARRFALVMPMMV